MKEAKEVYTIEEVMEKLKIPRKDIIIKAVEDGVFPFPSIKIGKFILFSKTAIDNFLYNRKKTPWEGIRKNINRRRWIPSQTVHLNYPCPIELNEKFNKVIKKINATLPEPLPKGDFIRLAIEEFIERRPEFLDAEDFET